MHTIQTLEVKRNVTLETIVDVADPSHEASPSAENRQRDHCTSRRPQEEAFGGPRLASLGVRPKSEIRGASSGRTPSIGWHRGAAGSVAATLRGKA